MQAIKWTLVVAILAVASVLFAAESDDVIVSHYEPLQRLSIRSAADKTDFSNQKIQQATPVALSFDALGRTFDLQLEPNAGLLRAASRDELLSGVAVYRGHMADHPGSWARIVVFNGVPRGLVWDGNEMFAIEAPGDSLLAVNAPVIFRLADAVITPGSMTCGTADLAGNGAMVYSQLVDELGTSVSQAPGAVSEVTLGAIADFAFTNDKGGDAGAVAALTSRLNIVDGIFSEQVGVQINVQSWETYSDVNDDPFTGATDPRMLLDELSAYRRVTPAQNTLGLTHLYTGRNLDSSTVGIAWRGGICSNEFGAGLSEGRGSATFDSLIAAHEIGHNFNAEHDGEAGTPCASEPETFIMAPAVNMNPQFSACSIAIMEAWAASRSCVTTLPVVDMSVALNNQSATVLLGANTVLDYELRNNGVSPASSVAADFTLPGNLSLGSVTTSAGTCNSGAGTVSCTFGDVPGMTSRTVSIAVTPSSLGAGILNAVVSADVDERPANNQSAVLLTVNPAVDLVVNTPTSAPVLVNAVTTVTAVLENRSILGATAVTLSISLGNGLQANAASWPLGACTFTAQQVDCVAAGFAAQSNATLTVDVMGVSPGSKNITVTLASVEAEANPANNSVIGSVRVNSANGKDEGGGTTSPIFLLMLALTTLVMRRRP